MIVYRLTKEEYCSDLRASGRANRWNREGQFVMYTSESISLCALELLAHTSGVRPSGALKVMALKVPDEYFSPASLPQGWEELSAYPMTQSIGSDWYDQGDYLAMRIPSALVPTEFNYALNTHHTAFEDLVSLVNVDEFFWDDRFARRES